MLLRSFASTCPRSLALLVVLACPACVDAPPPPSPDEGRAVERPSCDVTSDTDVASRTIVLTHLAIPVATQASLPGVNMDGLDNTSRPMGPGANVAGCAKVDFDGAVDNGAAGVLASIVTLVDVPSALVASYSTTGTPNDPLGTFTMEIELTHLSSATASDDACVEAFLHLTGANGVTTTSTGTGSLVSHRLIAYSNDAFVLPIQMPPLRPEDCVDGACIAAELDVPVRLPVFDLRLDDNNAVVNVGSSIAGVIFHDDESFPDAMRASGLAASLARFATDGNLDANAENLAVQFLSGARDLHIDTDGTLRTCSGAHSWTTDRNAISLGLAVDSL